MSAFKVLNFDGLEFVMKYADLLPPLSGDQREQLVEDIRSRGVVTPVVRTQSGILVDGNTRGEISFELGLSKIPYIEIEDFDTETEEREMAIALNLHRRHMTREQRAEWVAKLRSDGWSTTKIAEAVGVSNETVRTDLRECSGSNNLEPEQVTGADSKSYPSNMSTPKELNARQARIKKAKEEGASVRQIAEQEGVSVGTVAADLKRPTATAEKIEFVDTWTGKYRSFIFDVGYRLARFQIAAESDPKKTIRWELYPSERELLLTAESIHGIIKDLQEDLSRISSEVRKRKRSKAPHLRVL